MTSFVGKEFKSLRRLPCGAMVRTVTSARFQVQIPGAGGGLRSNIPKVKKKSSEGLN